MCDHHFAHRSQHLYAHVTRAACLLLILLFFAFLLPYSARADIAPPDQPPGANPVPGIKGTQVRMMAEIVTMGVSNSSADPNVGHARVDAVFTMQNLGSAAETMQVRFPLSFWNGASNGFDKYPQITDLAVKVNGARMETEQVFTTGANGTSIPWAAFYVSFPPGQDTQIEVIYTGGGATESPYVSFRYILETGAGWKDTIGSVDFIVQLPYDANAMNVVFYEGTGFMGTTAGAKIAGRQLMWHFEDLNPSPENNFNVTLVLHQVWNQVLIELDNLKANPNDGEAWGRLGRAYKAVLQQHHGLREDPGGLQAYKLGVEAYQKAVTLKPKDSLWHTGYADLLYQRAYYTQFSAAGMDYLALAEVVAQLKTAIEIDPSNKMASDLLSEITNNFPEALQMGANGYNYFILTATPVVTQRVYATKQPSATPLPAQPTVSLEPMVSPTGLPVDTAATATMPSIPQSTSTSGAITPTIIPAEASPGLKLPCVGSLALLPLAGLIFFAWKGKMWKGM